MPRAGGRSVDLGPRSNTPTVAPGRRSGMRECRRGGILRGHATVAHDETHAAARPVLDDGLHGLRRHDHRARLPWNRTVGDSWRAVEDLWVNGAIGSRERLQRQWELIPNRDELELRRIVREVNLDPGLPALCTRVSATPTTPGLSPGRLACQPGSPWFAQRPPWSRRALEGVGPTTYQRARRHPRRRHPYAQAPVGLGGDHHLGPSSTKGATNSWKRATPSTPSGGRALARSRPSPSSMDTS